MPMIYEPFIYRFKFSHDISKYTTAGPHTQSLPYSSQSFLFFNFYMTGIELTHNFYTRTAWLNDSTSLLNLQYCMNATRKASICSLDRSG